MKIIIIIHNLPISTNEFVTPTSFIWNSTIELGRFNLFVWSPHLMIIWSIRTTIITIAIISFLQSKLVLHSQLQIGSSNDYAKRVLMKFFQFHLAIICFIQYKNSFKTVKADASNYELKIIT